MSRARPIDSWRGKRVVLGATEEVGEVEWVLPAGDRVYLRSAATGTGRMVDLQLDQVEDITTAQWERDRLRAPALRGKWVRLNAKLDGVPSEVAHFAGLHAYVRAVRAPSERMQSAWSAQVHVPGAGARADLPPLPLDALNDADPTAELANATRGLGDLVWIDARHALLRGGSELTSARRGKLRFTTGPFAYAADAADADDAGCVTPGVVVTVDGEKLLASEAGAIRAPAGLVAARRARVGARAAQVLANQYAAAPWRLKQTRAEGASAAGLDLEDPSMPLGAYVRSATLAPCVAAKLKLLDPDWRFDEYAARNDELGTQRAAHRFVEWADGNYRHIARADRLARQP